MILFMVDILLHSVNGSGSTHTVGGGKIIPQLLVGNSAGEVNNRTQAHLLGHGFHARLIGTAAAKSEERVVRSDRAVSLDGAQQVR